MDIRRCSIGAQEERVLFECKGRFQENYSRYVAYILYSKHIPRKVVKIYCQMPLAHAIQRISKFFTHFTTHYEEDRLQDDDRCLSVRPQVVYDEEANSNTSKENEHVIIDLSDHSDETVEEESDIVNINDLENESDCSITILASGIFPRCQMNSHLSKNLSTQSELQPAFLINQATEFSSHRSRKISTGYSPGPIGRQVPSTSPISQPDDPLLSSIVYRTRLYRPRTIRQRCYNSQKKLSTTNQRQIQHYLHEFERLTHRVNHLYQKIDRIIGCHSFIHKSEV